MKKIMFFLYLLLICSDLFAVDPLAKRVQTDTSNFNLNLSSTDDNVQDALDTIDNSVAPNNVDYLVGTTSGFLSAEIVVGTSPNGDLGGTWGTISVDDDSHAHTSLTISGVDISADTNLTAGDALTLTDDDIDFDGGATPGGELGGTWASPTIDDNLTVTGWALGSSTATNFGITGTAGTGYVDFLAQASNPSAPSAGTLRIHSATTQGFTRMEQDNEATTNLIYGRDNVLIAKNTSGVSIAAASPVYVTGSTGNVPNIAKAKADSRTTLPAIGVALDAIADNAFGQVMKLGVINNIDTSAFSVGDTIYVSTATAGALQITRPTGTGYVQRMGTVLVDGVGNGAYLITTAPFIGNMEDGSKSFVVTGATTASDFGTVWRVPYAITLYAIHCNAVGGTNVVGQLTECDADGLNCAVVDSSDITCTAGTNVNDDGTLSNPTLDANDYLGLATTSVSGTNTRVTWTFEYKRT